MKKKMKNKSKPHFTIAMFHRLFYSNNIMKSNKNNTFVDTFDYKNIEYKDTIPFVPPLERGKVIKVYDGDTITVCGRFYDNSPLYRFCIRLKGVDSPEIRGNTQEEKVSAIKSRDALSQLILGKIVVIKNHDCEKYGRILADVYIDNIHVNEWLLQNHYAFPYDGGKKELFKSE
jgi:endonuclease YncB( thermonuclease family)